MGKRKLEIDGGSEPKFTSNPKIRKTSTASKNSDDSDYKVNKDNLVQGRSGEIGAPNRKCEFKKKVYD